MDGEKRFQHLGRHGMPLAGGHKRKERQKSIRKLWGRMPRVLKFRTVREELWMVSQIGYPGKQILRFASSNLLALEAELCSPKKVS